MAFSHNLCIEKCYTSDFFFLLVVNVMQFDFLDNFSFLSPLHLIAFLPRFHLFSPRFLLCSCFLRHLDHGKCTRPRCSPLQTGWPVGKQTEWSANRIPSPGSEIQICNSCSLERCVPPYRCLLFFVFLSHSSVSDQQTDLNIRLR